MSADSDVQAMVERLKKHMEHDLQESGEYLTHIPFMTDLLNQASCSKEETHFVAKCDLWLKQYKALESFTKQFKACLTELSRHLKTMEKAAIKKDANIIKEAEKLARK